MSVEQYFPEAAGSAEVRDRLSLLATSFAESVDDLFAKWETFAIRNGSPRITDAGSLDAFQTSLEKQVRTNSVKRPKLMPRALGAGRVAGLKMETDNLGSKLSSKQFEVNGYAPRDFDLKKSAPSHFKLNTDLDAFQAQRPFNESVRETSNTLDQQIESALAVVMQHFSWPRTHFSNPHNTSQTQVTAIGRVCRDLSHAKTLAEAKAEWQNAALDTKSLQIETSRRVGGGLRTALDVGLLPAERVQQLFEGEILVLKGKNPKGQAFVVDEVVDLPPLPVARVAVPAPPPSEQDQIPRICVHNAAGSAANLEHVLSWIMAAYAQQIARSIPSALVLVGPFVTLDAQDVAKETQKVADLLKLFRLTTAGSIPVFIIPHPADLLAEPVFPQPGYAASTLALDQPILSLSNPCTFSIGEVALTVSSAATLADMKIDSLDTEFRHVLRQRQIYPVYPPPLNRNISVQSLKLAHLDVAPTVLILPTQGESEMRVVDGVLCLAVGDNSVSMLSVSRDEKPLAERIAVDFLQIRETND